MTTTAITLALDKTGSAAANLISNEVQSIGTRSVRAFPVNYGLFFRESLVVVDASTGTTLTEGTQYYPTQMDYKASVACGAEIDSVIIITDSTVSDSVEVTYQALGGINNVSQAALDSAIESLDLNDSAVTWASVTNKPKKYAPSDHQHIGADLYGLEYIVAALTKLSNSILIGQGAAQTQLQDYAVAVIDELLAAISSANTELATHEANFDNPHETTAHEIGAYTTEESTAAVALEATNRTTADTAIQTELDTHIANTNNPHELTAPMIGGYSTAQSDAAMAAMQTAVTASVTANETLMNSHITNYDNPHQTTTTTIGTWTQSQITSAITAAATPAQQSVTAYETSLNSHLTNYSNPHGDTADNIGTWTYDTIESTIVTPYTSHSNNLSNPHADSYSELGCYSSTAMTTAIASAYSSLVTSVTALNSELTAHTTNYSNPHQDTLANTGASGYTSTYLQSLITNTLTSPK